MPLLATRPTRLLWQGLMRCYLLTLQIPPRLSVLGLLPPIISKTSPEGQPFWWLCGGKFQVGLCAGFVRRRSICSDLLATRISLHQVPRNIRTRSSIQVGRALVNGLHPTAPPQPEQQPKGGVRSYSPMVLYIYKSALNNIGDLRGEFGQYTSGGRLSGMPPGDARWRCTESA